MALALAVSVLVWLAPPPAPADAETPTVPVGLIVELPPDGVGEHEAEALAVPFGWALPDGVAEELVGFAEELVGRMGGRIPPLLLVGVAELLVGLAVGLAVPLPPPPPDAPPEHPADVVGAALALAVALPVGLWPKTGLAVKSRMVAPSASAGQSRRFFEIDVTFWFLPVGLRRGSVHDEK